MTNHFFIAVFAASALAISACGTGSGPAAEADTTTVVEAPAAPAFSDSVGAEHTASTAIDVAGTYKGTLPCADCEGIATTLVLTDTRQYTLTTEYLGKKEAATVTKTGNWTWKTGNIVLLEGITEAPNQYFVGEGRVFQLDMNGNRITGGLAEKYILTKQQ